MNAKQFPFVSPFSGSIKNETFLAAGSSIKDFLLNNYLSDLEYTDADVSGFLAYIQRTTNKTFHLRESGFSEIHFPLASNAVAQNGKHKDPPLNIADALIYYHDGHGDIDDQDGYGIYAYDYKERTLKGKPVYENLVYPKKFLKDKKNLRYFFAATCYGLKNEGHYRFWQSWTTTATDGLRMIFGFSTPSEDHSGYGRFFWEEWLSGLPLSRAWLMSCLRTNTYQDGSALSFGKTVEEAISNLCTQRKFGKEKPANNFYCWSVKADEDKATKHLRSKRKFPFSFKHDKPEETLLRWVKNKTTYKFVELPYTWDKLGEIAQKINITGTAKKDLYLENNGNAYLFNGNLENLKNGEIEQSVQLRRGFQLALKISDCNYMLGYEKPELTLKEYEQLYKAAVTEINRFGFAHTGVELEFDKIFSIKFSVRNMAENNNEPPQYTGETIFQFRQVIEGLASVNSDHAVIRLSFDRAGKLTYIYNSTRPVKAEEGWLKYSLLGNDAALYNPGAIERIVSNKKRKKIEKDLLENVAKRFSKKLKTDADKKRLSIKSTHDLHFGFDFSAASPLLVAERVFDIKILNRVMGIHKERFPLEY